MPHDPKDRVWIFEQRPVGARRWSVVTSTVKPIPKRTAQMGMLTRNVIELEPEERTSPRAALAAKYFPSGSVFRSSRAHPAAGSSGTSPE